MLVSFLSQDKVWRVPRVPGRDLEGGTENLSSYEFRHDESVRGTQQISRCCRAVESRDGRSL